MTTPLSPVTTSITPPIHPRLLLMRTPVSTFHCELSPDGTSLTLSGDRKEKTKKNMFSSDGSVSSKLMIDGSVIVNDSSPLEIPAAMYMDLSPSGALVCVFCKPDVLIVCRAGTGKEVLRLAGVKTPSVWPVLFFTNNDKIAAMRWTNEIKLWDLMDPSKPVVRVKVEGVEGFSLCPILEDGEAPIFATFQPGGKSGKPAVMRLFVGENKISSAQTFRADDSSFKWSPFQSGEVLIKTDTTHDSTNQSYYGESNLFLLSKLKPEAIKVIHPKEGAIHDFAWSPRKLVFCVAAGKSPARCTLYDGKTAESIFEYGEAHRNVVCFSPSGRFLCLAGFGNLAGDMEFWETKKNRLLGRSCADTAVGYGWSPCGRMFVTATLAPRMNVDNGMTVYSYRGQKIASWRADDKKSVLGGDGLLECRFLPVPDTAFPDLPASPRSGDDENGVKSTVAVEPPKPVAVYRPKHATEMTNKIAEAMRGEIYLPPTAKKKSGHTPVAVTAKPKIVGLNTSMPEPKRGDKKAIVETENEVKDPSKVLRKLKKNLREIDDILQNGRPLDDFQKVKIEKRPQFVKEIQELEATLGKEDAAA